MNTNNDAFLQHYGKFYGKAEAVLFSLNEKNQKLPVEELSKHSQTANTVISTFHRLLFGLDENQKAKAVSYKNGALETVLQLATAIEQSEETVLETLKTIKCCVVRCASGRNRCRSAGVFSYLQSRLDKNETNEVLMSEALTVLAAISLNNDLNALQIRVQLKNSIEKVSKIHSKSPQIKKMCTYLDALFDAVSKEQNKFEKIHCSSVFFDHLEKAQKLQIEALNEANSEKNYTNALIELNIANSSTEDCVNEFEMSGLSRETLHPLIRDIIGDIYQKRSSARYELKHYEGAIEDAKKAIFCLEGNASAVEKAEKVRIKSLVELKDENVEGEIVKAKLFVQDVNFLEEMMSKINLQKR